MPDDELKGRVRQYDAVAKIGVETVWALGDNPAMRQEIAGLPRLHEED
jgi:hypothetical protein